MTVACARLCFIIAHAPVTCAAAIEVPLKPANNPPGTEDTMVWPGRASDKSLVLLLKLDTSIRRAGGAIRRRGRR